MFFSLSTKNDVTSRLVNATARVPALLRSLIDGDAKTQSEAAWNLYPILSGDERARNIFVAFGGIGSLLRVSSRGNLRLRIGVAKLLMLFVSDVECAKPLVASGGINVLIAFLSDQNAKIREYAARALGAFAYNAENQRAMLESGAMGALLSVVSDTHKQVRRYAAHAFVSLAHDVNHSEQDPVVEAVSLLLRWLSSHDAPIRRQSIAGLLCLEYDFESAREPQNIRALVVKSGGIQLLVGLLSDPCMYVRDSAAYGLLWLAHRSEYQSAIATAGAICPLMGMLSDPYPPLRANAAGALGWLAHDPQNAKMIVLEGVMMPLVRLLSDEELSVRKNAVAALGWCVYDVNSQNALRCAGGIPALNALLSQRHVECSSHAARVLAWLAYDHPPNQRAIAQAGGIPLLLSLLAEEDVVPRRWAAHALVWLMCHPDNQQDMIAQGGLGALSAYAVHEDAMQARSVAHMLTLCMSHPSFHGSYMDLSFSMNILLAAMQHSETQTPWLLEALSEALSKDRQAVRAQKREILERLERLDHELRFLSLELCVGLLLEQRPMGCFIDVASVAHSLRIFKDKSREEQEGFVQTVSQMLRISYEAPCCRLHEAPEVAGDEMIDEEVLSFLLDSGSSPVTASPCVFEEDILSVIAGDLEPAPLISLEHKDPSPIQAYAPQELFCAHLFGALNSEALLSPKRDEANKENTTPCVLPSVQSFFM